MNEEAAVLCFVYGEVERAGVYVRGRVVARRGVYVGLCEF